MTICIGMFLGECALLVADTRIRFFHPEGLPEFYDDGNQKIQDIGIGLMTGAGYVPLLDGVKEELANTEISHTDMIIEIIKVCSEALEADPWASKRLDEVRSMTGWLFTYFSAD